MAKYRFTCSDAGINCGYTTSSRKREELLSSITAHASNVHNIREMDPELLKKVEDAIKRTVF